MRGLAMAFNAYGLAGSGASHRFAGFVAFLSSTKTTAKKTTATTV